MTNSATNSPSHSNKPDFLNGPVLPTQTPKIGYQQSHNDHYLRSHRPSSTVPVPPSKPENATFNRSIVDRHFGVLGRHTVF